jgi:adenylate cyclase
VRVNAQLINAETAAHLWAERFDREMGDLFALQNDVTNRIALAFHIELIATEASRPTDHPDALDYILRGRAARLKPNSRDVYGEVIRLYERALALDPHSVEAKTRLAEVLADRVLDGMSTSRANDITRAEALVGEALAASPGSAAIHFANGEILRAQGRFKEAIPEFETVVAMDRNDGWALFALAHCMLRSGVIEEVIPLVEQAMRLSPRDPNISPDVFPDWGSTFAPSACRRSNLLARKGARSQSPIFVCSRLSCFCLWSQR